MKSRLLADWVRRASSLSLLCIVFAWCAPAYSGTAAPEQKTALVKAETGNSDMQETKDRVKELEAREREHYSLELEGQRKLVDWWLTFIGVLAAIMAIAGGLIPYLMARKDKEILEQDKVQIRKLLDEVKGMKDDAEDSLKEIHRHEAEAEAAKNAVMNFKSGTLAAENKEAQGAAAKIEQDKTADPLLRLRAEAVSASKPESAEKAYKLWAALAELTEEDASAQFNAGYWAGIISRECQENEKLFWLKLAKQHSANSLRINPKEFWAACNWGTALAEEAQAIKASAPEEAERLMNEMEQLLQKYAEAAPEVVAYNLACMYGLRADVQNCLQWLKVGKQHDTLPDCQHLREDKDLDPVRNDPAFVEWFKKVCP